MWLVELLQIVHGDDELQASALFCLSTIGSTCSGMGTLELIIQWLLITLARKFGDNCRPNIWSLYAVAAVLVANWFDDFDHSPRKLGCSIQRISIVFEFGPPRFMGIFLCKIMPQCMRAQYLLMQHALLVRCIRP